MKASCLRSRSNRSARIFISSFINLRWVSVRAASSPLNERLPHTGALKAREAARVLAEAYDVEDLLHGSAVPLDRRDHLVTLAPPDEPLVAGVAAAAAA